LRLIIIIIIIITKQSFWDSPGITEARQLVEESKSDATQKAQFLAASTPHSGDWLLAPIAPCGLKLGDEVVRVAVALCLRLNLGAPAAAERRLMLSVNTASSANRLQAGYQTSAPE